MGWPFTQSKYQPSAETYWYARRENGGKRNLGLIPTHTFPCTGTKIKYESEKKGECVERVTWTKREREVDTPNKVNKKFENHSNDFDPLCQWLPGEESDESTERIKGISNYKDTTDSFDSIKTGVYHLVCELIYKNGYDRTSQEFCQALHH